MVVSIVRDEGHDPDPLEHWFSEGMDVRTNPAVGEEIVAFLKKHAAKSVIVTDGIIGCPHEEGIDYPEGNRALSALLGRRDRFTRELRFQTPCSTAPKIWYLAAPKGFNPDGVFGRHRAGGLGERHSGW